MNSELLNLLAEATESSLLIDTHCHDNRSSMDSKLETPMETITIDNITQAVIDHGDGGKTHPRLYEIYTSLVKHLHAFVRETI